MEVGEAVGEDDEVEERGVGILVDGVGAEDDENIGQAVALDE